jgi:iron complex outermembrane receptor protein
MTKNLLLMTCASSAILLMAGTAHAATASAAASASDTSDSSTNVTELVVTAEKRETSLQKVPVAVSVFTGAQRDAIGISTVADVTNFAPGFSYDPANVHAFIRGVGRQSVNVTNDQRVANYEDEFYVYSPYGLDKSSLFLSQEQIERGPQNVGGRNASGGSIDMISVRPTDQPYAEIRATLGNYGTENIEAAASGQIAPGLDVRIAGFDKNQNDGYYTNVLPGAPTEGNKIHEWYGEGQVDWKPNDQFEFWARAFTEGWDGSGDAGSRVGYSNGSWDETNLTDSNYYVAAGLFVNPNFGLAAPNGNPIANKTATAAGEIVPTSVTLFSPNVLNNQSASNTRLFADPVPTTVKINDYDDFNYIATYHAPGFDVKYTGGVQGYNYHLAYGPSTSVESFTMPLVTGATGVTGAGPLVIYPEIQQTYEEDDYWTAHDLTFQSTTESPLQWTAGGFAYYQHYNQPYQVSDPAQPQLANPLNEAGTALAAPNPLHQIFYYDYNFNVQSYGGYGQLSYKLNDQLKITGDVRYSYDDKYGAEAARYIDFNSTVIDGYSPYYGAATPSLDITPIETCLSGNQAHCNTAADGLGRGVTTMGVIGPNGYATRDLGITSSAVTGGAGVEWTPTSDIFTYARYDRGYAAPSFTAGLVLANPATQSEYINTYQVGYKESFGRSLLVDLAAFYYDYEGLQLPVTVPDGSLTTTDFINIPKSLSTGVEAEVYWTPVKNLVVTFSYSFDYSEIVTKCFGKVTGGVLTPSANATCLLDTNDYNAVEPGAHPYPGQLQGERFQSVNGNPLPDAPENKVAVDLAYTFHFEPGSLTLSGDYVYRGSQDGTVFNRFYDNAPGWDDVDLRALWKSPGDRYEVIGYMKNVFNTLQYTVAEAGSGLAGSQSTVASPIGLQNEVNNFELNPPRTFGVEVRYKFF